MGFIVLGMALCGIVTALAANARGRNPVVWFVLGCGGGIFGLIAVLVMENLKGQPRDSGPRPISWRSEDEI